MSTAGHHFRRYYIRRSLQNLPITKLCFVIFRAKPSTTRLSKAKNLIHRRYFRNPSLRSSRHSARYFHLSSFIFALSSLLFVLPGTMVFLQFVCHISHNLSIEQADSARSILCVVLRVGNHDDGSTFAVELLKKEHYLLTVL